MSCLQYQINGLDYELAAGIAGKVKAGICLCGRCGKQIADITNFGYGNKYDFDSHNEICGKPPVNRQTPNYLSGGNVLYCNDAAEYLYGLSSCAGLLIATRNKLIFMTNEIYGDSEAVIINIRNIKNAEFYEMRRNEVLLKIITTENTTHKFSLGFQRLYDMQALRELLC